MLFSKRLSLSDLIDLCRVLRHSLGAGLTLRQVFEQQGRKGAWAVRPLADAVSKDLEKGQSLEDALKPFKDSFPPVFLSLAIVGEKSGMLPEVFGELEKYFLLQRKLKREFFSQIAWPVFQLIMAIFVVAGLLLILGLIAVPGTPAVDPFGLGTGPKGALTFLGLVFGLLALGIGSYLIATRTMKQKESVDRMFLAVPVLGPCLRALALTRFCLALRLMLETGITITKALRFSLRATDNEAYVGIVPKVEASLREGQELREALTDPRLFPEDFHNILSVAEESGRLTDVLQHQSDHYEDETRRRMTILTAVASKMVWLIVAGMIIFAIFRIFTKVYLGAINSVS